MNVFELTPVSTPNGEYAPMWFDNAPCTWEDKRLGKGEPLEDVWVPPDLGLPRPAAQATPVLFNPDALAVSGTVREQLSMLEGVEFLPVHIAGHGTYFILHVTACLDLPKGSRIQRPIPGGNVVFITAFPADFAPTAPIFRLRQPPDSPAGRAGSCIRTTFLNFTGRQAVEMSCTGMLTSLPLHSGSVMPASTIF
jgi:hypothetical protein